MMLAVWLFENEFLHVVSITFTALVFNELFMVAFEIITWHRVMFYSEVVTIMIYISSMMFLKAEFGKFMYS
jgi:phospholipid-translocating ATPase